MFLLGLRRGPRSPVLSAHRKDAVGVPPLPNKGTPKNSREFAKERDANGHAARLFAAIMPGIVFP